ncbi:MAG: helix-turn-helix domain-containing protein [Chloroflexaceae bacterium]|jgi:DNA-binding transcriptional ArsR family regulator|nr:helix-turn-helix domain-containing protein [Chloroflexaceae bacterium]
MDENKTQGSGEPAANFVIDDLETLKVISDPLRMRLLELLLPEPRTVKQLAAAMQLPQTKLYYHVNQLEERGLIRVVETRIVSGIIEKQYRAVAYNFGLDSKLLTLSPSGSSEAFDTVASALFDNARHDLSRSVEAGLIDLSQEDTQRKQLIFGRKIMRLSRARAEELLQQLGELLRHEEQAPDMDEDGHLYGLTIALHPLVEEQAESATEGTEKALATENTEHTEKN